MIRNLNPSGDKEYLIRALKAFADISCDQGHLKCTKRSMFIVDPIWDSHELKRVLSLSSEILSLSSEIHALGALT